MGMISEQNNEGGRKYVLKRRVLTPDNTINFRCAYFQKIKKCENIGREFIIYLKN